MFSRTWTLKLHKNLKMSNFALKGGFRLTVVKYNYSNESYFYNIYFKWNIFMVICCHWLYNHVEFSLILTQGTYINSLFLGKNERNFILILIYYLEDIITFTKIKNLCISYYGFLIFWARHIILGVIFDKVHLGGVYIKWLFEK